METKTVHITYGFITGIIMVIIGIILHITGISYKPELANLQYITYVPFLVGILMNANAFSKLNKGQVTFGNVFGNCFKASMIITLVIIAWAVLSLFVFPDMKEKIIELARQRMINGSRKMTDEQMDMAISVTRNYYVPFMIGGVIFGTLIFGAVFSLIGGLVVRKNQAPAQVADNF